MNDEVIARACLLRITSSIQL